MNIKKITQTIGVALLLVAGSAFAIASPLPMLQAAANKMLVSLHENQSKLSTPQSGEIIAKIVDANLVPCIDVERMAGSVVGRQYWSAATPAQKKAFIQDFKQLVISTYSSALASYNDDVVEFYPLRGGYAGKSTVQVRSVVVRKSGQRIALNYNLMPVNDKWLVYDFTIEGVSMVQSYRAQFASTLAQGGMTELLKRLN